MTINMLNLRIFVSQSQLVNHKLLNLRYPVLINNLLD